MLFLLFALFNVCAGIRNHTKPFEHEHEHVDVLENSTLYLRDSYCSEIEVHGKVDIDGSAFLSGGSIIMAPGSSFSNSGTLVLKNTSKVIISRHATVILNNNVMSESDDTSVIVQGTLQIDQNKTISITAPIFLNSTAQLFVDSYSVLSVMNVTSNGDVQINTDATLVVNPNSTFIMNHIMNNTTRRKLLQTVDPGTCVFNQAVLSGSGLIDCNVVFSGVISGALEVESLTIDSLSQTITSPMSMIVARNNIKVDGELVVDLTDTQPGNFTVLYSDYGVISGTFSKVTFMGSDKPYSIEYTQNSVNVVTESSRRVGAVNAGPPALVNMVVPVVGVVFVLVGVASVIIRRRRMRDPIPKPEPDVEYGYVNPLIQLK